jgi:hypothetical protein
VVCSETESEEEEEAMGEEGEESEEEKTVEFCDIGHADLEEGMVSKTFYLNLFIISYIIGRRIA